MSDPARFGPNGRAPIHPVLAGHPPGARFHPTFLQPYGRSPAPGVPTATPNDPANPIATHPAEDYYPHPSPAHLPWNRPFHAGPIDVENSWRTPQSQYHFPGFHGGPDPYASMGQYGHQIDNHYKRFEWREVLLTGDPEKAINDNLSSASRVVVSFVTRGPPEHPHGQGQELLFFGPPQQHPHYGPITPNGQSYCFAVEVSLVIPQNEGDLIPSAPELSKKSLTSYMPRLDVAKDLKLVRRGRPLLWDSTTVLETFLYRVVEGKENPESTEGRDLEERLGAETHTWKFINNFADLLAPAMSDTIVTAIISVYLPPDLSLAFDRILSDQDSRPDALSLNALAVLYSCVTSRFGRQAFTYYPVPPPPPGQKEYELCDKRRLWAYWTEVIAWHLSQLREDAQVSTSYTLLKSLYAVKDSVDDPKISLDELERLMIHAIASEADRSRHSTDTLIREGISECLHNPIVVPPDNALDKMHIITAGTSTVVFNVIAKLITHVLARKPSLIESSSKSTVSRRIMDLKITIAESRPLSEGVMLAGKLSRVVDSYLEYRDRGSKHAKQDSPAPSVTDLETSVLDPKLKASMMQGMSDTERFFNSHRLQPISLGLSKLLAELDSKKEKKEPKVSIELITDAAVVSTVMAAGGTKVKPIILLGADRIFANGDVVNKVGSAQMAWAGKLSGGIVLILCRGDRIHSKGMAGPPKASSSSDELVAAWEPTLGREFVTELQNSKHVKISNPTFEDVNHDDITGYITELGFMGQDMLSEFSNMRCDLEKAVWRETALTK